MVVKILSEQDTSSTLMAADYLDASIRPADNGNADNFEKLMINVTTRNLTLCIALVLTTDGDTLPSFPPVTPLEHWLPRREGRAQVLACLMPLTYRTGRSSALFGVRARVGA